MTTGARCRREGSAIADRSNVGRVDMRPGSISCMRLFIEEKIWLAIIVFLSILFALSLVARESFKFVISDSG